MGSEWPQSKYMYPTKCTELYQTICKYDVLSKKFKEKKLSFDDICLTIDKYICKTIHRNKRSQLCISHYHTMINTLRTSDEYMHHWFRYWLVAWSAPCHYRNQCWNINNWTLRNTLQWNFDRNSFIFIQENVFEAVVCEIAAILSRPQCVNHNNKNIQIQTCVTSYLLFLSR